MVHSTFEYFPGLPIFHSKDLVNWEIIGYAIHRKEQMQFSNMPCSEGLYAPTIRYLDGMFYVVCTNVSMGGNFYVTAENPEGPWSDPIWVDQGGIDPSLFFDTDGTVYFTSNSWVEEEGHTVAYIAQSEIEIETGKRLTEPRDICRGTGGRCLEAPHLYHIGEYYYLICAEGGTDLRHMTTAFRSRSPYGPFEAHPCNPILTARDEAAPVLSAVGHGDILEDKYGQFWMIFLCYRTIEKYHHLGRETSMIPIEFTSDGWLDVRQGKSPDVIIECPEWKGPDELCPETAEEVDDFTTMEALGKKWNFLRESFDGYSLSKRGLIMKGNHHTLDDLSTPAWIGKRQQHFNVNCRTVVRTNVKSETQEAGLSALYCNCAWYAVIVSVRDGRRAIVLKKRVEDMYVESFEILPDSLQDTACPVELFLDADEYNYSFGYVFKGEKHIIGTGMAKLLSTEVHWGFTGVFIGMYAVGTEAIFESFIYKMPAWENQLSVSIQSDTAHYPQHNGMQTTVVVTIDITTKKG